MILWCDGLKCEDATDDSGESSSKKRKLKATKEDEVQQLVEELMKKYGSTFTTMQFRIWAMISGGLHSDSDNPPSTSMFARAGNASMNKKSQSINQVITEAANAITSSLSPRSTTIPAASTRHSGSPSKLIEDRSKLYKQLSELHRLRSANILIEEEYMIEKDTIMELLKKLMQVHRNLM